MSPSNEKKQPQYDKIPAFHCEIGKKPSNDDGYFEKLTMIVFRSGLNWSVIEKKWPAFIEAFNNFSIKKVVEYDVPEVDKLMENEGIIRNYRKVVGTIKNAKEFLVIKKSNGSFSNYLDEISKDGEEELCNRIGKRFAYVGKSTSMMFLKSVGLDMPEMTRYWMEKQGMI